VRTFLRLVKFLIPHLPGVALAVLLL